MEIPIFRVTEITAYIKNMFFRDPLLSHVKVSGEISNYKKHSSGHIYFTLKDEMSVMRCVMFKSRAAGLKTNLKEGMHVIVTGSISVYEGTGQYQLYAEQVEEEGLGNIYERFLLLKDKLEKEGYFDPEKKKPIPKYPKKIAVLTSMTGAVLHDIQNVITRRYPFVELVVIPIPVQGYKAYEKIAEGIRKLNDLKDIDVAILARGGGSLEELWNFNEEEVAKAIFTCNVPIVSAIGHQTDTTICDYVADLAAPTPSAAAELVVPDIEELKLHFQSLKKELDRRMIEILKGKEQKLVELINHRVLVKPEMMFLSEEQKIDLLSEKLFDVIENTVTKKEMDFKEWDIKLDSLNPLKLLEKGYSVVLDKDNKVVKSIYQTAKDEIINIRMADGAIKGKVVERIGE